MKRINYLIFCIILLLSCKEEHKTEKLEGGKFILQSEETNPPPINEDQIIELKEEDNKLWVSDIEGFKEITNYPICYSHESIPNRTSLIKRKFQEIPTEYYPSILPSSIKVDSNEAVFPMHRCAQKMYTIATYLIRSKVPSHVNQSYSDQIYLIVYDQGDSIISSTGGRMKDEFDSFYELSITSSTTITTRTFDKSYSSDEEQTKNELKLAIDRAPEDHKMNYLINHETLTFDLIDENPSLNQEQ
ncbi:MAG: hypothetical protein MK066_11060 [Crocinitomicaceae bacterium]|nr:hypothetical protein [Crocinitomicaceae bacterium]